MSRIVAFGEIMGRLAAPGSLRFAQAMPGALELTFAGAEVNAAVAIAQLGGDVSFVTALPDHAIAAACVAQLRGLGVSTSEILRTSRGRLGLYFLETGANQRPGQVIYDREHSALAVTPAEAYDWDRIFAGAEWLLISGITPAVSRNAAEVTRVALRAATAHGLRIAFDMNFRAKLWQWEPPLSARELASRTLRDLLPEVDLLIGGREDFESVLDAEPGKMPGEDLARALVTRFPRIVHVGMTLREGISAHHNNWGGMLYDARSGGVFYAPGVSERYAITQIVDRLGAGDAFTGALLYSLIIPELSSPEAALRFATAASCLAHSIQGDYNLVSRADVEALLSGDDSGRVRR